MASNQIRNTLLEKAAEIMNETKDSLDIIDKTIVSILSYQGQANLTCLPPNFKRLTHQLQ